MNTFLHQPKPFYMIFMLEIWERFGFYMLQTIIVYNIFHLVLKFPLNNAAIYFGAFFALVYGLVSVGGFIGDKLLGPRRTLVLGLCILTLGYGLLALSASVNALMSLSLNQYRILVFFTLGVICTGNGVFKANPTNLLSRCYEKSDSRIHGAFTLYYMSINIGSIFAQFFSPIIAKRYGFDISMLFSTVGLIVAGMTYVFYRHVIKDVISPICAKPLEFKMISFIAIAILLMILGSTAVMYYPSIAISAEILIGLAAVAYYMYIMSAENEHSKRKMIVALILMLQGVAFFVLYAQMSSSINAFAITNMNTNIFGIKLNPQSFQAFIPFWILVMSPVLSTLYAHLEKKKIKVLLASKFAFGMTISGFAFTLLYISHFFCDAQYQVSSWWVIGVFFLQSIAELLISALGLAMVAEMVPTSTVGFVMGMWFISQSFGGLIGGYVAKFTIPDQHTLMSAYMSLVNYTHAFLVIGLTTFVVAIIMWTLVPKLNMVIQHSSTNLNTETEDNTIQAKVKA